MICNRGGGADGDPPLKSCSCVCYAELVFSCTGLVWELGQGKARRVVGLGPAKHNC